MVAGGGQRIAISAAIRGLLQGSTLDRAPIFSAIYLLCYSGATFPSIISGELSNAFSLPQIAFGYGVLALVATLFTVLGARNPHTDATGNSPCDSSSTLDDAATAFNPTERRAEKTIIRVRPSGLGRAERFPPLVDHRRLLDLVIVSAHIQAEDSTMSWRSSARDRKACAYREVDVARQRREATSPRLRTPLGCRRESSP